MTRRYRAEVVGGNVVGTNERMDERETIEAVYELGGTKATYVWTQGYYDTSSSRKNINIIYL